MIKIFNKPERHKLTGYMFISPWIIGFLVFMVYPLAHSLILSFGRVTDFASFKIEFTGVRNYINAFILDIDFMPNFLETVKMTLVNTPLILVLSLFTAILLSKNLKGKGIYRAIFFLPVLLGTGMVMQQILGLDITEIDRFDDWHSSTGISNAGAVRGISLSNSISVFLNPELRIFIQDILDQVIQIFWKSGIQMLIFIGALQGIPEYLYESARCDGATTWEMFWKITLPMISPAILLNSVFTLIDSFTSMNNSIMVYTIQVAFKDLDLGYGSALGWIFFIFVFAIIGLVFLILKKYIYYLGE